jgi:predicted HTH domain antitoxin
LLVHFGLEGIVKHATISYPEGLAETLSLGDEDMSRELAFLAAAKLYELGRLSSGQAADLARLERLSFLRRLAEAGVPAINIRGDEVRNEISAARDLAG